MAAPCPSAAAFVPRRGLAQSLRLGLFLWLGLGIFACNPIREGQPGEDPQGQPDGGGDPAGTLTVTPGATDVTLNNGMDQVVLLKARSALYGDVTDKASWTISDQSAGTVQSGKVTLRGTAERGGSYTVSAFYRNQTGGALVNVKVNLGDVMDTSAPADAKDYFTGGGGGPAPQIVYPFDNTMMAPNVLQVVLQWRAGSGQQVFRIDMSGPVYSRTHYVGASRCPGGLCSYPVDDKVWSAMGHTSAGKDVQIVVHGSPSRGGQIGQSTPIKVLFSPEDIKGGLYYFTTTIKGIKRVPLGASKPVDFVTNGAETGCAGCHSVTRDGKKVAIEFGSANTNYGSTVVDGANSAMRFFPLNRSIAWNFSWFDPKGDKLITNWNGALTVRDAKNGQILSTVDPAHIGSSYGAAMPEWSPDGNWIAFVRKSTSASDYSLSNSGDIVVMPYNGGAFGPGTTLVKATSNSDVHFWPSWTPDSKYLVFNTFECAGTGCGSYNAQRTRLRIVRAIDDMGKPAVETPVELLAGTHEKWKSNNWPKVAPFLQAGRIIFVVYSAMYPYGHNSNGRPQLFMFGVDLSKLKTGDPSYQPVWLPFQEAATNNHSAIWTTDVACVKNTDCPAEFDCVMGSCVPRIG